MFAINKNGTKHKIGIIMPAFYPASRITHESVSVTADGVKTYGQLIGAILATIDMNKVTNNSQIDIGGSIFRIVYKGSPYLTYSNAYFDTGTGKSLMTVINCTYPSTVLHYAQNGDSVTPTNMTNTVVSAGTKVTLYYD